MADPEPTWENEGGYFFPLSKEELENDFSDLEDDEPSDWERLDKLLRLTYGIPDWYDIIKRNAVVISDEGDHDPQSPR